MIVLRPIGFVKSTLSEPATAPKQAGEGAPEAWLEFSPSMERGLQHVRVGDELWVLTWLHRADRETLEVHPRDDITQPLLGVFSTRSADRPNPIGLHRVTVLEAATPTSLRVDALEAINNTPILDLKPVLDRE